MIVLRVLWLAVLLLAVPIWVGNCFLSVDNQVKKLPFLWISGQMALWAGFQIICVPMILLEQSFTLVVWSFTLYSVILLTAATIRFLRKKDSWKLSVLSSGQEKSRMEKLLWILFWVLLAVQLVMSVCMAYSDGDDAYYVALSAMTEDSDQMYHKIPYTGETTVLDARHGLAPFPVWIAYLSRMTGIRTVSVAQVLLPLVLIPMTYGIYNLLGSRILIRKKELQPLFLVFTELLVLFGDYSFTSVENFMIARSRQGKAALGSILIPMILLLLALLVEKLQEQKRPPVSMWILLGAVLTACCLCSTMGALLGCMLIGVTGLCAAFSYGRFRFLVPLAACCTPCVVYALLYLLAG